MLKGQDAVVYTDVCYSMPVQGIGETGLTILSSLYRNSP